jgi:hypothetical protein
VLGPKTDAHHSRQKTPQTRIFFQHPHQKRRRNYRVVPHLALARSCAEAFQSIAARRDFESSGIARTPNGSGQTQILRNTRQLSQKIFFNLPTYKSLHFAVKTGTTPPHFLL